VAPDVQRPQEGLTPKRPNAPLTGEQLEDYIEHGQGPYSPDERAIVITWIKSGIARNEIARRTGRGGQTVSRGAKQEGLNFDRTDIMTAPRAAKASDLSLRRLSLAAKAADKLDKLLDDLDGPLTLRRVNTRTGETVLVKLTEPDPAAKRDIAIACGILFDKLGAALKGDENGTDGRAAIINLVERLQVNVARENAMQIIEESD